ncbi:transmembrane protein, partial [Rhynchospora pubera]
NFVDSPLPNRILLQAPKKKKKKPQNISNQTKPKQTKPNPFRSRLRRMADLAGDNRRLQQRRSGLRLLRRSLASFLSPSSLPSLLLASLLLLSFRSALLFATLRLSSLADSDPSLRHLLSRLSPPPPPASTSPRPRASRPPFIHLSRISSLDDDNSLFSSRRSSLPSNASFSYSHSTSNFYKITIPPSHSAPFFFSLPSEIDPQSKKRESRTGDLRSIAQSLDLSRKDLALIVYILGLLSTAHAITILSFITVYSCALGIVFYSITSSYYLQKPLAPLESFFSGASLGTRRLVGLMFLRWAVKDAISQFLSLWFFADIQDQVQLFKLFVTSKLLPFSPLSLVSPVGPQNSASMSNFFLAWAMIDSLVSVMFTIVPWVAVMERNARRPGRNSVKEGCYLVSLMPSVAVFIKWCETLLCGSVGRSLMARIGGRFFGGLVYSLAEVYFMVVWFNYFILARCTDAEIERKSFGLQDLEESLNDVSIR